MYIGVISMLSYHMQVSYLHEYMFRAFYSVTLFLSAPIDTNLLSEAITKLKDLLMQLCSAEGLLLVFVFLAIVVDPFVSI